MNFGSCKAYKKSLRYSALSAVTKFFNCKSLKDGCSKYIFTKKMSKWSIYDRVQYKFQTTNSKYQINTKPKIQISNWIWLVVLSIKIYDLIFIF